ncbi:DNA excision repair protein ERCC-5 homolog isoform X2 [Antennarius striatus]|uniref:DNA excision repair protein ERCC-5 homolog isoform X2 n=1 Tax=Antennarius striatus TaxID=241820 RepID=UPI0035AFDD82
MGVHGLWRLLESTGKPINPETLEGKILAVDISIWLNQALKGVRDREGISIQNAHLLTLFNRICKLLFFRIRPVFVFDGEAPLLKKQTLALRRKRKEEMNLESKQTNEKLLKTFLKRQAIKAALGNDSKDPLPSLSSVRRDEVDDMYVLPALPAAEERDKSSSSEEDEGRQWEETADSHQMIQGELFEDPNSVDVNSEEFACLPAEMKHEMLKDMKEFSKRRRTMFYKPPEDSGEFSQYQLVGLLQRNKLNQHLEGVEKEMSDRSASGAPLLYEQDGEQKSHSVEANRLVSEDHSHYILIKGSKKTEIASESRPAALPWSGSFLSGSKRRAGRPEPLWGPVHEDEEKSKGSNTTASKSLQDEALPPSPRTLKAIQAAMDNGSDEEKTEQESNGGGLSPRTQLAIQQALTEEEDDVAEYMTPIGRSHTNLQENAQHPVPQVVISSSEEEPDPGEVVRLPNEKSDLKMNHTDRNLYVKDSLLISSSEDDIEEVIRPKNKALPFTRLHPFHENEVTETKEGQITKELEKRRPEQELITKNNQIPPLGAAAVSSQSTSITLSPRINEKPGAETHPVLLKLRSDKSAEAPEGRNVDDVKSEGSESEDSFIEVSEEEFVEDSKDDSLLLIREKESQDQLHEQEPLKEEKQEEHSIKSPSGPAAALTPEEDEDKKEKTEEEEDLKEGTETESSSTPAVHEWENFDMDELEALESSLQVEQSSLRELKQQQERMANSVTGQMYLETQELLRLFGIPFLIAPMEAEAQCAALDHGDQTHGTITDDSDVWLFGGRHVYKNFFSQNKYVEHYQSSDLQSQLGLDRTKLINLAYLLGSDYTEGVPGVGFVTGMEILNEFPGTGLEPLIAFSKWWSEAQEKKRLVTDPRDTKVKKKLRHLKLHPGFPNPAVAQAYLQPAVDQTDSSFSWGRPQLDMIKEFCLSRFGWSSRRTEETLQPVIKQLNNQQTQLRIDSFFRMEQQEKAIRSQRLRRAVTCMKRKDREGGEEEDDSEEEIPSPSKSMRGKEARKRAGGEREEERVASGGGFLGSEVIFEPRLTSVKDVSSTSGEALTIKAPQSTQTPPRRAGRSSTSSSGEDSDNGGKVAMVTARSVFDGGLRGCGAKSTRGRRNLRGKGRGKRL